MKLMKEKKRKRKYFDRKGSISVFRLQFFETSSSNNPKNARAVCNYITVLVRHIEPYLVRFHGSNRTRTNVFMRLSLCVITL